MVGKLKTKVMAKKAETAPQPKVAKTVPQFSDTNTVVDVVEDIIQNLQNAISQMELAIMKLDQELSSTSRMVSAKRTTTEVIASLKPYLES